MWTDFNIGAYKNPRVNIHAVYPERYWDTAIWEASTTVPWPSSQEAP
jgi:hypothetical protein